MPEQALHTALGNPFIELDTVDSTNNYALRLVHAGLAQAGTAIFAHQQLSGKGQRGKSWVSEKENSLSLSLIIDPAPAPLSNQFALSACIASALCELLGKYTGEPFKIKWPNDIYWHDRKAGGILVESVIGADDRGDTRWKWAVAGIGINVNQVFFPEQVRNPVSLRQITGRNFMPVSLARDICPVVDELWQQVLSQGFDQVYESFNSLLYKKGELVRLKAGPRTFSATLKYVNRQGELVVDHGVEQVYQVTQVQLLPDKA